jgi:transcriptional regulator with XRE-family HTH domain
MPIKMIVGKNIRRIRELRGWSQGELSKISGLHRTYISGVECGDRNVTVEMLVNIASALNTNVLELLKDNKILLNDCDEKMLDEESTEYP